jgi:ankyrin repeat protein
MKSNLNKKFNESNSYHLTRDEENLIAAATKGDAVEVAALIDKGTDVFAHGEQAVRAAAGNGHLQVVKLLAAQGSTGFTQYDGAKNSAETSGHADIAAFLKQAQREVFSKGFNFRKGRPFTALEKLFLAAAEKGDAATVAAAIKKGVDVTLDDERPLGAAADNGHLEVVKLLTAAGSTGYKHNGTIAIQPFFNGHWDVAKYLDATLFEELKKEYPEAKPVIKPSKPNNSSPRP